MSQTNDFLAAADHIRSVNEALEEQVSVHGTEITVRYETDAMAHLRKILREEGFGDATIDIFQRQLAKLERRGFSLRGPSNQS